ncbi:ribose 1,5-bisphosphate phosphokinase PhnN [Frondihabitans sucicola]|uniref:Ribose 1,5-bisphosphate phosphokinase PhnN n=1 Tax=Frondihabitans sucicola TaxID=1268041 RepID=A0ABN6Y277_9MICO|nr:phosphonate metabolism protein/1,5-bisphosphokinase (PRPP-forming) PhnN [Frondihabitans sucicola]BDZ51430.1 ribose 1,5-bisphosphate phosphokinase PhnN [Frondihabitans sucicola]
MTGLIGPGAFIAVSGASGVGKDTLLDLARDRCGEGAFFPRRVITRPGGPGEDHLPVTRQQFIRARLGAAFAVTWHAHGLDYGIPAAADGAIRAGQVVVANVSRGVIPELRGRYERVVSVRVTVSDEVRAARLRARGRESVADITERLSRIDPATGHDVDHEIRNDGTAQDAGDHLIAIVESAMAQRTERS